MLHIQTNNLSHTATAQVVGLECYLQDVLYFLPGMGFFFLSLPLYEHRSHHCTMNCGKPHSNQGTVDILGRYIKLYTYFVDKTA